MRRADREVTDPDKIQDIIDRCTCCRIGFNDDGKVYIVPLNFGYSKDGNAYVLYFHGAHEGRKIDLIRKNPDAGFEMDTNYLLTKADIACRHSARFQSVIGNGIMEIVEGKEEKIIGLNLVMKQNTGKGDWDYHEKYVDAVTVFKLIVTEMTCKEHS